MAKVYTFRVGDPVWGKVKGFSAWPGKIVLPPDGLKVNISLYRQLFLTRAGLDVLSLLSPPPLQEEA